jgi:polyvinyl alcohol dehydrogenase (cytochrome)
VFVGTGNAYTAPAAKTTDSVLELSARTGALLRSFQATANDVFSPSSLTGPDFDFGASPNLITSSGGRALVGEGQKSGTHWALDRSTLAPVWSRTVGAGSAVGGIIGSTAYDGQRIFGPATPVGEQWALSRDGGVAWVSADGGPLHFSPTTVANGVVYTADQSGVLTLREAATGAILDKLRSAG